MERENLLGIDVGQGGARLVQAKREGGRAGDRQGADRGRPAPARMGGDHHPGFAAGRQTVHSPSQPGMKQEGRGTPGAGRQYEPARGGEPIGLAAPKLGQHHEAAAAQGFFGGPQGLLASARPHDDQPVGIEAMALQARPVGDPALARGAVVHDPDQGAVAPQPADRDRDRKTRGRPFVARRGRGDLVQGPAPEAAAQQAVELESGRAERDRGRAAFGRTPLAAALDRRRRTPLDPGDGVTQDGDVIRSAARRHRSGILCCVPDLF